MRVSLLVSALLLPLIRPSWALPINSPLLSVYDYIVVGGGASGLTVANRLTENPDITVLVLEAGPADDYEEDILVPVFVGRDIVSQYNWDLFTVPQIYLDGKVRPIPQGKALGGGTILNAMLWNRGGQGDYDSWEQLGNPGWGWTSMLPYFRKSETYTPVYSDAAAEQFSINYESDVHGYSGPVNVSYSKYFYNSSQNFFDGLNYLGVPTAYDPNDGTTAGAYYLPLDIDPNNQTRSDARLSYYEPYSARNNFYVSVGQHVTQLVFDNVSCLTNETTNLRVIGVEYAANSSAIPKTVYARREVILAAGSLHTPQLLQLSGIGPSSLLQTYNISTRINLPGVGNNLQDHYQTGFDYPYLNESYIYPSLLGTNATWNNISREEYYTTRTGPYTAGPPNGVAFPSLPDISNRSASIVAAAANQSIGQYLTPGLDPTVIAGYAAQHLLLVEALGNSTRAAYELLNDNTGYFTMSVMRPFTRGTCYIASTDPFQSPAIDFRYGANPIDLQILLEATLFQRKLVVTPPMLELQPAAYLPHSDGDEAYLVEFIKNVTETEYHPSGTCAMLPLEHGGVVDSTLLVYGTQNLRIVDASVQPMPPAAHLQAVVYGVAEKHSDYSSSPVRYSNVLGPFDRFEWYYVLSKHLDLPVHAMDGDFIDTPKFKYYELGSPFKLALELVRHHYYNAEPSDYFPYHDSIAVVVHGCSNIH